MRGSPGDPTARSGRSTIRKRVVRERRILRVGLGLSLLLHLLLIGLIGGLLEREPGGVSPPPVPLLAEAASGMRAIELSITPAATAAEVSVPPPASSPMVAAVRAEEEAQEEAAPAEEAGPADDRTAADRLAPRLVDSRLWRPVVLIPREPTLADVQARIAAAMELLSDSALADTQRQLDALDWTVLDKDGERWGISPRVLHLGKLKIPLPLEWVEEYSPERGEWYDLEAQVDRTLFLESFEDRVRKIRERRERERRERQEEGGAVAEGSGSGG